MTEFGNVTSKVPSSLLQKSMIFKNFLNLKLLFIIMLDVGKESEE